MLLEEAQERFGECRRERGTVAGPPDRPELDRRAGVAPCPFLDGRLGRIIDLHEARVGVDAGA
jgi:hypothetical protein